VQPCHSAAELGNRLAALLNDPAERRRLGWIGQVRMGPAGGSARLAEAIATAMFDRTGDR
jgi:hypothetical protein